MSGSRTTIPGGVLGGAPGRGRRWWLIGGAITGFLCVLAIVAVGWWPDLNRSGADPADPESSTSADVTEPIWDRPAVRSDELAARSGVTITQLAVTGNGGLIDLRYQVVDANAATALHEESLPPALIDDQTGLVVHDLVMNHAHTGQFHQGETYYLVFENPDNWIRRGATVTVLLGPVEVRNVTVQ